MCKQHSYDRQSPFNHSNENMNIAVFSLDCPQVPFWSVLFLNRCRLFKIYTSYIILKYGSAQMINITFFAPAFLALVSPN